MKTRGKLENQFLKNYVLMFVISGMVALCAFVLMDFANHVISTTLIKNSYSAEHLMRDDYRTINAAPVIQNGGGVQVVNSRYEVVFSAGLNTLQKDILTAGEFTDFLMASRSVGIEYSYSIRYNPTGQFWLVVTFPTSIRIDFAIAHNKNFPSADLQNVAGALVAIILFYLILLAASTVIYSKITSISIINPLRKLINGTQRLRDGDYSARIALDLTNEFTQLQDTFNSMAEQIEKEIALRRQSEETRKKLILDISHDLKNPLASILGYAELCRTSKELTSQEQDAYLKIIYENSLRTNSLITGLFDLAKIESPEFILHKTRVDVCEYLREEMGKFIAAFDVAGFGYGFDIPEEEIFALLDTEQMDRVFQNLAENAVRYNPKGTKISVGLKKQDKDIVIFFQDNGAGIPEEAAKDVFKPFVRADKARNSQTGGTGLGLAIVSIIVLAHGGTIDLKTDSGLGCAFSIRIPWI